MDARVLLYGLTFQGFLLCTLCFLNNMCCESTGNQAAAEFMYNWIWSTNRFRLNPPPLSNFGIVSIYFDVKSFDLWIVTSMIGTDHKLYRLKTLVRV